MHFICVQKELVDIRELMERGDNVQRLSKKLAGIKRKRVSSILSQVTSILIAIRTLVNEDTSVNRTLLSVPNSSFMYILKNEDTSLLSFILS